MNATAVGGVGNVTCPVLDGIKGDQYGALRVAVAATIGGTASVLSGGKFANGAVTSAFSRLFNDEIPPHKGKAEFKSRWDRLPTASEIKQLERVINELKQDALFTPGLDSEVLSVIQETDFVYQQMAEGYWGLNSHDGTIAFSQAMRKQSGELDLSSMVNTFFHEVQHSIAGYSGGHVPKFYSSYQK